MTDTPRTPDDIARAEYSARVWEQMQDARIEELLAELDQLTIALRDAVEMGHKDEHRATVAEWECARLRERLETQRAELTQEIRVAIEHQANAETAELHAQLASEAAERIALANQLATVTAERDAAVDNGIRRRTDGAYEVRNFGIVIDDAMMKRAGEILSETTLANLREGKKYAAVRIMLTAALSTATLVPLASGEVVAWQDGTGRFWPSQSGASTPLYRGATPTTERP